MEATRSEPKVHVQHPGRRNAFIVVVLSLLLIISAKAWWDLLSAEERQFLGHWTMHNLENPDYLVELEIREDRTTANKHPDGSTAIYRWKVVNSKIHFTEREPAGRQVGNRLQSIFLGSGASGPETFVYEWEKTSDGGFKLTEVPPPIASNTKIQVLILKPADNDGTE